MKKRTIEALERAAWYARLALGTCPDKDPRPPAPQKDGPVFYVLP